jgi:predicted glycoside hydrolase/deacetylase ChbG (UPF0249 family)
MPNKTIILCADDYAQNKAINAGILTLAANKRLNAISCLVNSKNWKTDSLELEQIKNTTYLGLHFNLTEGSALSSLWQKNHGFEFWNLSKLILYSYLHKLDQSSIEAEVNAQLQAFLEAVGKWPDFIDGHQHVHQLPQIRNAIMNAFEEKKLQGFCRSTSNDFFSFYNFPKAQIINILGGISFKNALKKKKITTNSSFSGIYNFKNAKEYSYYFQKFLKIIKDGGLIMCHPATIANKINNSINPLSHSRALEFQYLASDNFLKDLVDANCVLQSPFLEQQS